MHCETLLYNHRLGTSSYSSSVSPVCPASSSSARRRTSSESPLFVGKAENPALVLSGLCDQAVAPRLGQRTKLTYRASSYIFARFFLTTAGLMAS